MARNEDLYRLLPTTTMRPSMLAGRALLADIFATTLGPRHESRGFLNARLADPHGHPALANAYAVYFNPAALGGIDGSEVVVDGTLVYRTVDYERVTSALSPSIVQRPDATYVAANTGQAHAANVLA